MKKIICLLLSVLFLTGCSSHHSNAAVPSVTEAAMSDTPSAPTQPPAPTEPGPVRVALIDTGISTEAIPQKNIGEGKNYLDPEAGTEDTFGHGTKVASVILNTAPDALLIPLVCTVYNRGSLNQVDNLVFAGMIRDAVDLYHCQIINISAGIGVDVEQVRQAVAYAEEKGVLVIASAGNDYRENPDRKYYPAAYTTVLSVGALNKDGTAPADFSQQGDWVDLYAPGVDIPVLTLSGAEITDYGTSLAAAHVCGQAVLLLESDGSMTAPKIRDTLQK